MGSLRRQLPKAAKSCMVHVEKGKWHRYTGLAFPVAECQTHRRRVGSYHTQT